MEKIYTPKVALFINTNTAASPTWTRAGKGVTSLSLAYNPQTSTEQYINESSSTTSTDSYQVASDLPLTCYAGEPIFEYIDAIRRSRAIGSAAEVQVLVVYLYKSSPYAAELNNASIAVNDFGGDAGAPVVINSTISFNGDPTIGTAVVTNGVPVFTATSAAALTVTSVPADAATAVARASSIALTFSNEIKTESVSIVTAAGVVVAFTKSWDAAHKVLTLTPSATMAATTVHIVSLAGVVDVYGQALAATAIDFTTAA